MLKKIRNLCIILLCCFIVTGCVKYEMRMEINDDKSMDFTYIELIESTLESEDEEYDDEEYDDMLDLEDEEEDAEVRERMEKRGYTVEEYIDSKEPEYTGIKISKHFDNIDNISKEGDIIEINLTNLTEEDFDDSLFFTYQKGIVYNVYKGNFQILNEDDVLDEEYASLVKIKFSIKLPKGAFVESNATSVSDDKTELVWDLKSTEVNKIYFSFKLAEKSNLYMAYASVGIIALLIIVAISSALKRDKKKKEKNNEPKSEQKPEEVKLNTNGVDLMAEPTTVQKKGIDLMAAPVKQEGVDLMASPDGNNAPSELHPNSGSGPLINAPSMNMVDQNNQDILDNVVTESNSENMMPTLEGVMNVMPDMNNMMPNLNNNTVDAVPGGGTLIPDTPVVNESNGVMPTLKSEEYVEQKKPEEMNFDNDYKAPTIIKPKDTSIIENIENVEEINMNEQTIMQNPIPEGANQPVANSNLVEPSMDEVLAPIMPEVNAQPQIAPVMEQQIPEVPMMETPVIPEVPVIEEPIVPEMPAAPSISEVPVQPIMEAPVIPEAPVMETPVISQPMVVEEQVGAPMMQQEMPALQPQVPNPQPEVPVIEEPMVSVMPEQPVVDPGQIPMTLEEPIVPEMPAAPSIPEVPVQPMMEAPVIPEVPVMETPVIPQPMVVEEQVGAPMMQQEMPTLQPQVPNPQPEVPSGELNYNFDFSTQMANTTPNPQLQAEPQFMPQQGVSEAADYTNVFGSDFQMNVPVTNIPEIEPQVQNIERVNAGPIMPNNAETVINQVVSEPTMNQGQ